MIVDTPCMGEAASRKRMSPAEYLAFERTSAQKHEYAGGEVFAMAGGTFSHSRVQGNFVARLTVALEGRDCATLTSDMRVKTVSGRYFYPDASVFCGPPRFEDDVRDTLLNPTLVVEVLSDGSEAYDRGDKFDHYETIHSLREYVLASQKAPRVEVFTRQDDGSWIRRVYHAGQRVPLASVGCELDVEQLYERAFAPDASG